ncbi:hypothetical protein CW731_10515 [Polaribacter sp. ALD11]|uniref:hypothetical protein n=1 Tax=Polaribacter sp. ALD11 TaxID=2058137 RepID=UPI000C31898B|nr:hypothetical protein [Polaribacter sp. ALD11]AUC85691.1 hypothetical protein CW731_10515 [Polaribacter sp. ALD11]
MKTAAIFLSLFLLLKPILPLLEYAAFYDFIKNELCENIDKPELECNGKCYLAKQIVKAGDSESSNKKGQSFSLEYSVVYFQETNLNYGFLLSKEENLKIESLYNRIYKFHFTSFVFHPPLV